MGCGASSDGTDGGHAYAVGANDDAVAAAFDAQSAHADLPHDAFDRPATAAEIEAWEAVDDMWSVASGGAAADEPSAMALSLRMAKAVLVARVSQGINGDANQFAAERELPMVVYRSVAVVDAWMRAQLRAQQACSTFVSSHTGSFLAATTATSGGATSSPETPLVGGDGSVVIANMSVDSASGLNTPPTPVHIPAATVQSDDGFGDGRTLLPGVFDSGSRRPSCHGSLTIQALSKHEQLLKQTLRRRGSSRY